MLRAERWWLLAVQGRATQIYVGQPIMTSPGTLRSDFDTPDFLVSASLVACFSRSYKRTNLGRSSWYTPPGTARGTCSPRSGPHPPQMMCVRPPPDRPQIQFTSESMPVPKSGLYGACPKNESCSFSGELIPHCTGPRGVGNRKILYWPAWREHLPRRSWLTARLYMPVGPVVWTS